MCILSDVSQKHFVQGQRRPINHHYVKYQAFSTEAIQQSDDISQYVKAPLTRSPWNWKVCLSTKCLSTTYEMFINSHGQNQMAWFEINQGFTVMTLIFLFIYPRFWCTSFSAALASPDSHFLYRFYRCLVGLHWPWIKDSDMQSTWYLPQEQ